MDSAESDSQSNNKVKNKYELTEFLREKIEDLPEVLDYIVKLQNCINKQRKKLKKYQRKHRIRYKTVATQTEEDTKSKTIAEEITEAALQTLESNGFVYEETSGLYYDYNSGYYYNAEYGLYYDGNSGTYLKYNQDTKEYEFHSQVVQPSATNKQLKRTKRKSLKQQDSKHAIKREKLYDDLEEGECSDASFNTDKDSEDEDCYHNNDFDYAKPWPPCMRIIVEESNVAGIKTGTLFLMTYDGGTLGREGQHALLIPDINVSKVHVKFHFDTETNSYYLTDLGSQNGTFLNGQRLSASKAESAPTEIPHGSRIQVGGTTLLCHIHSGSQTCGHCEPGLLLTQDEKDKELSLTRNKSLEYKKQLKQLRKKFGISHTDQGKVNPGSGYTDRAQQRRDTIGSQNPHEKTQVASIDKSIQSDNKGFKMLAKMGWKEGEALGKDKQGMVEPIELVSNPGTSGMGNAAPINQETYSTDGYKVSLWKKTQERFNQIPDLHKSEDIFNDI